MSEPEPVSNQGGRNACPVFVSYATADRTQAMSVCKALENRGISSWISARDVAPGDNYQEAIVQTIRTAPAMVLVFSEAANSSDEIKKELSLASRYHVPVIALRLKNVEPSDAFAYELSTRQWIDAFKGWGSATDALAARISELSGADPVEATTTKRRPSGTFLSSRVWKAVAALGLLLLATAGGAWWWRRPPAAAAHSMTVRMAGFQILSADLPRTMRDTVDAEIAAAFNADGVVGVSNATTPVQGSAPAYSLGGTIERDGHAIRVITRLVNERSGATLWSDKFNYDGGEVSRVPRHIAVDAGNVVRCGLFGASTYRRPLPDSVLADYMQFCQGHWDPNLEEGRKALVPAQRVVAAVPDFSWGWAAVAGAYWKVAMSAGSESIAAAARASGRQAADRAVAIDGRNSEALYIKSMLVDRHDWLSREGLLKRAIAARRLDCGCEHHQYGWMLLNVGRTAEAVEQLHQADNMLALYVYTPVTLADALVVAGKRDQAKTNYEAAIELAPDGDFAKGLAAYEATQIGDVNLVLDPELPIAAGLRSALLKGYRAMSSPDAAAKSQAVEALLALPQDQQSDAVARLLGGLGARREAFQVASRIAMNQEYPGASLLWYPSMRGTLYDPRFPALAKQLGLLKYWTSTHTKPDVCSERAPPPFCWMI